MFKKKKPYLEIDQNKLKKLQLFETINANSNPAGYAVSYTRVPTGLVRTTVNNTSVNQQLISLPASYFVV
jgi:hypothetical protein